MCETLPYFLIGFNNSRVPRGVADQFLVKGSSSRLCCLLFLLCRRRSVIRSRGRSRLLLLSTYLRRLIPKWSTQVQCVPAWLHIKTGCFQALKINTRSQHTRKLLHLNFLQRSFSSSLNIHPSVRMQFLC